MGNLKENFLRPKITKLKFELSSLSGPMLKTRKNTKRNQFQQQWFDVITFHKPICVYPAISYDLKSFAHKKGKFTLSTLAKCTSHVFKVCQRAKRYNKPDKLQQSQRFCVQELNFTEQNNAYECMFHTLPWVSQILELKNQGDQGQHRQEHLWLLSNGDGDCVTFHRLTA